MSKRSGTSNNDSLFKIELENYIYHYEKTLNDNLSIQYLRFSPRTCAMYTKPSPPTSPAPRRRRSTSHPMSLKRSPPMQNLSENAKSPEQIVEHVLAGDPITEEERVRLWTREFNETLALC